MTPDCRKVPRLGSTSEVECGCQTLCLIADILGLDGRFQTTAASSGLKCHASLVPETCEFSLGGTYQVTFSCCELKPS